MPSAVCSTSARAHVGSSLRSSGGCVLTLGLRPLRPALADEDERRSRAALAESGEAALLDRDLVGTELAVPLELGLGGLGLAGLEVDDAQPPLGVALDAVDPPRDDGPPDLHAEALLDADALPLALRRVAVCREAGDHVVGLLARALGHPPGHAGRGGPSARRPRAVSSARVASGSSATMSCTKVPTDAAPSDDALAADGGEEPPQAALGEVGDLRGRDGHRLVGPAHGPVARDLSQRPPRGRVGAAHPLAGRGREQVQRRLGDAGVGADGLAAQLADEPGQRHRARDLGVRPHLVGEPGRRRRVDEVEVDGGLLVLVADRGDEQALGGPGDGDEEEARLVVADGGLRGTEAEGSLRHDVDEVLGAEDRAAQAQVGPDALLHPGDDDDAPLAARPRSAGSAARPDRRTGRRRAACRRARPGPGCARGTCRARPWAAGRRRRRQRRRARARRRGRGRRARPTSHPRAPATPRLGDARALPDRPEHGLGRDPGRPSPVVADARRGRPGGERCADALRRAAGRAEQTGAGGELEQLGEQLVAGSPTTGGELVLAQHPPQPAQPHGVGPADR